MEDSGLRVDVSVKLAKTTGAYAMKHRPRIGVTLILLI